MCLVIINNTDCHILLDAAEFYKFNNARSQKIPFGQAFQGDSVSSANTRPMQDKQASDTTMNVTSTSLNIINVHHGLPILMH